MYHNFYHLQETPFHITPDTEFLFLSPSHKQALDSIIYGVRKRWGLVLITGEAGVGKTTILRFYIEMISKQKTRTVNIFNSNVSFHGLLKTIYEELRLDPKTDDVVEMLNGLRQVLLEEYKLGHVVLLIVDEAQKMPVETLMNLHLLCNVETSTDKLLQIVVTGQPEFEEILDRPELRQLKECVAIRSTIVPFTETESMAYIRHRLAKVTLDESPVFTHQALKKIVREARGIPRTLNTLCDNALITGFGYRISPVNTEIVKEVLANFRKKDKPSLLRWALAPAALLSFVAVLFLIYGYRGEMLWEYLIAQHKSLSMPKAENRALSRSSGAGPIKEEAQEVKPLEVMPSTDKPEISQPKPLPVFHPPVTTPVIRKVQEGDNLFRLTLKVYGRADDRLVAWVKQNNPWIKDINNISVGKEIIFPEFKEKK